MTPNEERIVRATVACDAYAGFKNDDPADPAAIADLVVDLLHLAERKGCCVESLLATARMHYEAECREEVGR